MSDNLIYMSGTRAKKLIKSGDLTSEKLVSAYLSRCTSRNSQINAWGHLSSDKGLAAAKDCDTCSSNEIENRPLHGLPIGIKDIIDTTNLPTEYGSKSFLGYQPSKDAYIIKVLRNAGAIIMGKTITTEFALSAPPKTQNPHDPDRTPGGSSSGSAAAVADFMVPFSIGSQTGGSTLRPASYCGIYGFKPSFGTIPCYGMMQLAQNLDHIGVFARSLQDIALLSDVLMATPISETSSQNYLSNRISMALQKPLKRQPKLAFVRGKPWQETETYMEPLFLNWVKSLKKNITQIELEPQFDLGPDSHSIILNANLFHNFNRAVRNGADNIHPITRARINAGQNISISEYLRAIKNASFLEQATNQLFLSYDALITASALGEPPNNTTTGSSVIQRIWTMLGTPSISLPLLTGPNGLPIGIQIIAAKGNDALLMQVANWIKKNNDFAG